MRMKKKKKTFIDLNWQEFWTLSLYE